MIALTWPDAPPEHDRRDQLAAALASVRARIADACREAGRDPRTVTLIAVTKSCPAQDAAILVQLGVPDLGENKEQEASAKVAATADLLAQSAPLTGSARWHFIGQLQRRKARAVAGYAFAVHSVDRRALVPLLADGVRRGGRAPLHVFVQLSLDGDPARGGVAAQDLMSLADAVAGSPELRLCGLMAVAPMGVDPDSAFGSLAAAAERLRATHPGADAISAGMSADLEAAVRHGATHLRVGTALLGRREQIFG